ncbi:DNA gyrase subunit A [uncultured Campylobacter sp.]|uniref:DNA gyrase subunit A n=1 Tax=uncultured Campylobacter sp. TaxID=218934 RepID=UPI0026352F18|nr:DNA gyrase subunit A [uncultured Campylobacter sp.]
MDSFTKDLDIEEIDIENSIKASYLDYSMSVIIGRALPDARDGLKPVHRRILYAMNDLGVTSRAAYKKSARIVGDVIGKYHPHGDTAVYDALVRMAQSFSMRYPSIDGQGNFGSIDGDGAAAMRYTEARMTILAEELLRDIDKDTVDFVPNYDDSLSEPDVLPARLPNLLLNGSSGIAVGMATNIPPHSLNELVDGLIHLLDNKNSTLEELMNFIKGPDFPTAGIIYGKKGIIDAYRDGRGRVKVRAKTHIENKSNKDVIVIDELPYQTNKARLIEQIADLAKDKTIQGIADIRDESDREGIRVVIELKRDADTRAVLNNLFKSTAMENTFSIIMLAIHNKEPKIFSLIELLKLFLSHRKTVIIRRAIFDLQKAKARAHILEGLKIALDDIDRIINLIRSSKDNTEAKEGLISKFSLSELQANAILDMRLARLTGLEREKIENELKELKLEIENLEAILKSESKIEEIIKEELLEIKSKFNVPRLTEIVDEMEERSDKSTQPNINVVVTITEKGYIKRVDSKIYERQKRGGKGKLALTTHDDDFIKHFFTANTHDVLMFVTNKGQLYKKDVFKIDDASRTSVGRHISNVLEGFDKDREKIMTVISANDDFSDSKSLCFFTKNGIIKRTNLSEYKSNRANGVRAINLDEGDELVAAFVAEKDDKFDDVEDIKFDENFNSKMIFIATKKGMCIKFPLASVREIGRVSRGVTAIRFKEKGDEVVGAILVENNEQEILSISKKGIGKRTNAGEYRLQNRGGKGVICMKLTEKTKDLVCILTVEEDADLMVATSSGKTIRVDMQGIKKSSRNTIGVIVVNVENDEVISVDKCPKQNDENDDNTQESIDMKEGD